MIDLRMQQNTSHSGWQQYFAVSYRAQLLEIAGIVVGDQAQGLAKYVYLKKGQWLLWRDEVRMLGLHLHRVSHIEALQLIAALACEGSFRAVQYWEATNQALVQGAWPWLIGYSEGFAKTVFLTMASLFVMIRHGSRTSGIQEMLFSLAAKLIGGEDIRDKFELRREQVVKCDKSFINPQNMKESRSRDRAEKEKKARVSVKVTELKSKSMASLKLPGTLPYAKQGQAKSLQSLSSRSDQPSEQENVEMGSAVTIADDEHPWTFGSEQSPVKVATFSSHIIQGSACNHGKTVAFTGRYRLASSLTELQEMEDPSMIVVTRTFGNARAVEEVMGYLGSGNKLSVKIGEEQCVSCAVKLAHTCQALVVVT